MKNIEFPGNSSGSNHIFDLLGKEVSDRMEKDSEAKTYLLPKKIIWQTQSPNAFVSNSGVLLKKRETQISLIQNNPCVLHNQGGHAAILLDFGVEICGGLVISSWSCGQGIQNAKIRIRFGESAMEAMSDLGEKNSGNNHAPRDITAEICYLGTYQTNCTGFRFARIDLLDDNSFLELKSVKAFAVYKDIPYLGSFQCSDELLNSIWKTGAITVHLNMQNGYIWDGIKRDRLVWIGDMHPEIKTIQTVFGYDDSVCRSLDFIRDETPLPGWMNQIPTYSMWWILEQYELYLHYGNLDYLRQQESYLRGLTEQLSEHISPDGLDTTPDMRFIDWDTYENKQATGAGIQALHILAAKAARELLSVLGDQTSAERCKHDIEKLKQCRLSHGGCKQEAALMVLAGLADAETVNREVISVGGSKNMSTFMGYYILKARALAGDIPGCLDCIREFWGGMLQLGSTTFWEVFNTDWLDHAAKIDEIAADGKRDVHGDYGDFCYTGYRKSLCHGWAAGPTPWLSEFVLGIRVEEPGCKTIRISPALGDLEWAEGTYPTPYGLLSVRHEKQADGSVKSFLSAPKEINIIQ